MLNFCEPANLPQVHADEAMRIKMEDLMHSTAEAMETPNDTMLRLFNGVSASCDLFSSRVVSMD